MMPELEHTKSILGDPRPSDIFEPHLLSVELFSDMDEFFRQAREHASGENEDEATRGWKEFDGQRAVAIVTPGRLIMFSPCPKPGSKPEEEVAQMGEILPAGPPPLRISAISYTFIEALTTAIDKAIPFRGFLIAWAYLGHSVLVFEGHPSAFESGVRDCDMLLVDSGMLPFVPLNWVDVATRVMKPEGRLCPKSRHNRSSRCALCLGGSSIVRKNNHRGAEHTEVAQRRSRVNDFWGKARRGKSLFTIATRIHSHKSSSLTPSC